MEDFSGYITGEEESAEKGIGVYAVPRMGWFACNWGVRRGPYLSRELAENELTRMYTTDPGLAENWLGVARVVGGGLLCSSVILAGALFLTLVVWAVGSWMRPF
jgi:hypothetical protein